MNPFPRATRRYQMFINDEFVANASRDVIPVINPATEEVISEIPSGEVADVEDAVQAAEKAQMTCRKLPAIKRASYVREIAQGIRKNKDFLARMISEEQDKVRPLAEVEVNFTADHTSIVQGDLEPN